MSLVDDWRSVLRKAWSVRLIILAGALSGAEVVLPMFQDAIPRGVFASLSGLVTAAALFARVIAQPEKAE